MVKDKDELLCRADEFMDDLASYYDHVKSNFEHPKLDNYDEIWSFIIYQYLVASVIKLQKIF